MDPKAATFASVTTATSAVAALALLLAPKPAQAVGVFDIPRFVAPTSFAVGLEPEVIFSDGAGVGVNAVGTYGLNDLLNVQGILGTGSGPREWRFGGNVVFDVVPDIEHQPGIGIAGQTIYYRVPEGGRLEFTAIPYLHKNFTQGDETEIDPFLAFPLGWAFTNSEGTVGLVSVAVGVSVKNIEHLRYIFEFGAEISNAETYFSGGVAYSP